MRSKALLIVVGVVIGVLFSAAIVLAGSLDPSAGPDAADSQMYTLEQIYTRLSGGGNASKMTTFREPLSGPGSTMHTLDEIYALAWPARVPKTGQTTNYAAGDDGALQKGVAWPNPRFTDNSNGTVTDNLTGLIWLQNASCGGTKNWANALTFANSLYDGWAGDGSGEDCGLSDSSTAGQWRLPNRRELLSLIDDGRYYPALPSGHPFTVVQSFYYWTSTSTAYVGVTPAAWLVYLAVGDVSGGDKTGPFYVWPVRGGQ